MICPRCENGKVFHRMAHVRASKDFGRFKTCPQCNGSGIAYCRDGENVSCEADEHIGDKTIAEEAEPLVA